MPVVKRDITEFPEDDKKTKNTFVYEFDFVDASEEVKTKANTNGVEAINMLPISKMVKGTDDIEVAIPIAEDEYFTNKDAANCAYKCELYAVGCEWPYSATDYLTITEAAPFTVRYRTNVVEGYNTTYCLKCSNSLDSITQDDIVVVQRQQTNWALTLIIVAAAVCAVCSCGSFFVGRSNATGPHVEEAEKRSTQMAEHHDNQKVVNKEQRQDNENLYEIEVTGTINHNADQADERNDADDYVV